MNTDQIFTSSDYV